MNTLINKLGEKGIYTLVDMHQDVLSRRTCGEGIPNFYAHQMLEANNYCYGPTMDIFARPITKRLGLCTNFADYNMRYNEDGDPLWEDCHKTLFSDYYLTSEVITLFRGIFFNEGGM